MRILKHVCVYKYINVIRCVKVLERERKKKDETNKATVSRCRSRLAEGTLDIDEFEFVFDTGWRR